MIAAVINTKNSAATLARCLRSVSFVDEIIVVDMKSVDKTVDIAKKNDAKVFSFRDVSYVEPARNFALQKTKAEWILVIDADEEVSPGLREFIMALVTLDASDELAADVYAVPRRNTIFGKPLSATGWWPDHQIRLFRNGFVTWNDAIHSVPLTKGRVVELPAEDDYALIHYNYESVDEFITRMNRYTTIEATGGDVGSSASLVRLFSQEFLSRLAGYSAFDDGVRGVGLSLLQALYPVVAALKKWEMSGKKEPKLLKQTVVTDLAAFASDIRYWVATIHIQESTGLMRLYWRVRRKLRV